MPIGSRCNSPCPKARAQLFSVTPPWVPPVAADGDTKSKLRESVQRQCHMSSWCVCAEPRCRAIPKFYHWFLAWWSCCDSFLKCQHGIQIETFQTNNSSWGLLFQLASQSTCQNPVHCTSGYQAPQEKHKTIWMRRKPPNFKDLQTQSIVPGACHEKIMLYTSQVRSDMLKTAESDICKKTLTLT